MSMLNNAYVDDVNVTPQRPAQSHKLWWPRDTGLALITAPWSLIVSRCRPSIKWHRTGPMPLQVGQRHQNHMCQIKLTKTMTIVLLHCIIVGQHIRRTVPHGGLSSPHSERTSCVGPQYSWCVLQDTIIARDAMRRENTPTQTTTCSMIICHVSESWGTVESQLVARRSDTEVTGGERPPSLSHTPIILSSCWSIRRKKIDGHIHCFQSMDTSTNFVEPN